MTTVTEIATMRTMMTATAPPLTATVMDGVEPETEEEMCSTYRVTTVHEVTQELTVHSNISGNGHRGSIESGSTDVLSSLRC